MYFLCWVCVFCSWGLFFCMNTRGRRGSSFCVCPHVSLVRGRTFSTLVAFSRWCFGACCVFGIDSHRFLRRAPLRLTEVLSLFRFYVLGDYVPVCLPAVPWRGRFRVPSDTMRGCHHCTIRYPPSWRHAFGAGLPCFDWLCLLGKSI